MKQKETTNSQAISSSHKHGMDKNIVQSLHQINPSPQRSNNSALAKWFYEKREKGESLIFVIKKLLIIHIGLGYIYTC